MAILIYVHMELVEHLDLMDWVGFCSMAQRAGTSGEVLGELEGGMEYCMVVLAFHKAGSPTFYNEKWEHPL